MEGTLIDSEIALLAKFSDILQLPYLSGAPLSSLAAEQMVLGVLHNKLMPPLRAIRSTPCCIQVHSESLENYLNHLDVNGRKQGLKFLPVLANQMAGPSRPNLRPLIPRGRGQSIRRGLHGGRRQFRP